MNVRIKEIMQEKGVSSVKMADMIHVSKVTISNLINNKTMPSIDTLEKIATALGVPIWQLFVSPSDVTGGGRTFKCPKCGLEFEVELKPKENINK